MKRQLKRNLEREMKKIASRMINFAKTWEFNGLMSSMNAKMMELSKYIHQNSGTNLIFTRDSNHHLSGWLRNPDYERCWHLSLSPIPTRLITPGYTLELNKEIIRMWCEAFFGEHLPLIWMEGPKSEIGKKFRVYHWRLFADEHWNPILPRKEVYSSEFTEIGWKSASEIFELTGQPKPESTIDPT